MKIETTIHHGEIDITTLTLTQYGDTLVRGYLSSETKYYDTHLFDQKYYPNEGRTLFDLRLIPAQSTRNLVPGKKNQATLVTVEVFDDPHPESGESFREGSSEWTLVIEGTGRYDTSFLIVPAPWSCTAQGTETVVFDKNKN